MSWTFLRQGKSIARKSHPCIVCNSWIMKGTEQFTRTGVDSSDGPYTMHMHPVCERFTAKWDDGEWECHSAGNSTITEIMEWAAEQEAKKGQP